jgi:uncharacterized protein
VTFYFDTSALAKLIISEPETPALRRWLSHRREVPLVTNTIGAVELTRLATRVGPAAQLAAAQLLARIDQLELTPLAVSRAGQLPPPEVRTLDALHVGSASELADLQAVVTYDRRMAEASEGYGLPVQSPGHQP